MVQRQFAPSRRAGLLTVAGLVLAGLALQAQSSLPSDLFDAQFGAESEPVSGSGDPWPVPRDERSRRIMDEAAWVYSGMIWGFQFSYTPYDKLRGIPERFDLVSLGSLKTDDPRLTMGASREDSTGSIAFVRYSPIPEEEARVLSYGAEPWRSSQGIGRADYLLGSSGHRAAYEDGLRVAVRSLLQLLEPNKPRLVRGRVVFERVPTMGLIDGFYTSQVRVRVEVSEILRYEVY
ncbi:MAG TPA: hypothetical protein VMC79_11865 [Rectinemataceae bacterium]|nr:hypothetical protein [Rectinemataceae bacterium]